MRLTRSDSARIVVYTPQLVGDTVEGLAAAPRAFGPGPDSIRVALPEIKQLATRKFSWGRSLAVFGGGLVAGTVMVILVECQTQCAVR